MTGSKADGPGGEKAIEASAAEEATEAPVAEDAATCRVRKETLVAKGWSSMLNPLRGKSLAGLRRL